ncbi:hypothetical protein SDC9_211062 [bioreactor metagenome]|uniref:Uncharacterized protein n=1 Tax=bioreactor metagenome TaxID=1076179 RepID=A0A645JTL1_9ZZZZ
MVIYSFEFLFKNLSIICIVLAVDRPEFGAIHSQKLFLVQPHLYAELNEGAEDIFKSFGIVLSEISYCTEIRRQLT